MNLKNKVLIFSVAVLSFTSCMSSRNIEVSKASSVEGGLRTIIYSLPKTKLDIDVAVTRILTKAGPYASYADKYLSLKGVPSTDAEVFEISAVKIVPVNEPDPDQYYAVTFRNYPSNIDRLFSMTSQGLMLNPGNAWEAVANDFPVSHSKPDVLFGTTIREPNISEKVDTLYKTILTDASFVKVPIYKKSLEIKTEEDRAKDMAELILKIRKRRLKLMMGEYDYHPEGAALEVIVRELAKQEEELMSNFIGKKVSETKHYSFSFTPAGSASKELLWFSEDKGALSSPAAGANAISVSVMMNDSAAPAGENKKAGKLVNSLYFRSPLMTQVTVKLGQTILSGATIPVYQAGEIRELPVQ
jgi:hypothetical protein